MFQRADVLWLSEVEGSLPYHALGFDWHGFEPTLTCVDHDGNVEEFHLERTDYVISRKRRCVGRFEGDRYLACPSDAEVTRFVQCADCAEESFIPYQECIFEPKCDGELCDTDFCRREHILYLAFYDTRAKIGMSSTRRVRTRLIEQGADAYALIGAYPTRRSARTAEKEISSALRVPQAFRQDTLLKGLTRTLDAEGIEAKYASLSAALESRFGLRPEAIEWLDDYPLDLPLDEAPQLIDTPGRHKGDLLGLKGRWMIYRTSRLVALNMSDIPSRFLDMANRR